MRDWRRRLRVNYKIYGAVSPLGNFGMNHPLSEYSLKSMDLYLIGGEEIGHFRLEFRYLELRPLKSA